MFVFCEGHIQLRTNILIKFVFCNEAWQEKFLTIENIEDELDNVALEFRVEKSWAEDNNLGKEDLMVSKFNEVTTEWDDLETSFTDEDDTYYYYDVELDSFSYFAISEKVVVEDEVDDVDDIEGEETEGSLLWLWILIILVIAGAIGHIVYNKKHS